MAFNITLAYFVVGGITPSPKQNRLTLCGKSFLFILRLDGLNIVSNKRYDPDNDIRQIQWNKIYSHRIPIKMWYIDDDGLWCLNGTGEFLKGSQYQ